MIGLWLDLGYLQEHYLESSQTTCESSQPGVKSQHVSQIESTTSDVIRAMTWHILCGINIRAMSFYSANLKPANLAIVWYCQHTLLPMLIN